MSQKITKAEAEYRDKTYGDKRCGNCSMYRNGKCTLVKGHVSAFGYCIHWSKK